MEKGVSDGKKTVIKRAARGSEASSQENPSSHVYQEISRAILEQRLKPGTKLGEQQLSGIFRVNRPVVRQALMRLSYEKLVDSRPNRGAFVASPTPGEARQVFEARRVIEDWIIRACVARIDAAGLARLKGHIETEAEAVRRGDRVEWISLSGAFHLELAAIAGNARLTGFLGDLIAQTSLIISLYGTSPATLCCSDEHGRLVADITAGDREAAAGSMSDHLRRCEEALRFDTDHETNDLRAILAPFDDTASDAAARRRTQPTETADPVAPTATAKH